MTNLSIVFSGMHFPNPFMLATTPPARNAGMIKRAFAAGWGGAVTKTIGLEPVHDLQPRLQPLRHHKRNVGMEMFIGQNAELTGQVVAWVKAVARIPVVVKLTPPM